MTVTGKTMAENLADLPQFPGRPGNGLVEGQTVIGPSRSPSSQRATSLSGNLAPPGFAVGKITGKEGTIFRGPARCFDQWEIRRKSSSERLTPHERAIAIRWIVAFVEPPVTMTSRTEFSKALAVMMSRGMRLASMQNLSASTACPSPDLVRLLRMQPALAVDAGMDDE